MCSNEFELCKLSSPDAVLEQKSDAESRCELFDSPEPISELPTLLSSVGLLVSDLTEVAVGSFIQWDIPRSEWTRFERWVASDEERPRFRTFDEADDR